MKINKLTLFEVTTRVVIWMFRVFNLGPSRSPKLFYPLLRELERLRKSRGIIFVVSLLKDTRVAFWNYLAGNPRAIQGVRCTQDGIPILFGDLIPLIRRGECPEFLRVLNTILVCTRALSLGTVADTSPITDPLKCVSGDVNKYVKDFWKELGYSHSSKVFRALKWKKFHLTTKVGPNSENDNALFRALSDLTSLDYDTWYCIQRIGGPKISKVMDLLYAGTQKFHVISDWIPFSGWCRLRKLTTIRDKELKVRVIAIGDYWSQTVLLPLHNYLFRVLKKIPQDCTFSQDSAPGKLKGASFYSSIDLSNATDRFPIALIADVLRGVLPEQYIQDWKHLMVGLPFDFNGKMISYSVGNPMGFYSSWASFAVAHHYVIYYCCRECNVSWKDLKYCLLGDDIVITNQQVSDLYKKTIKSLGVDYSAPKTYESTSFYEFAKRLFLKEVEISPFPISGLEEVSGKYYLLTQFFLEAERKCWISINGVPAMVESYLEIVTKLPARFRSKLVNLATIYEHIQRIVRGSENAGELLTRSFRILGYPHTVSNFVARNVLENIAVELFASSNPATQWDEWVKSGKITLNRLESQVRLIGAIEYPDDSEMFTEFCDNLPTVGVVNNISWDFQDLAKEAEGYSNSTNGTWPLLLKATAYPLSSDILSQRSSFLISRTVSKIVKFLKDRAEVLNFYPAEELLRTTPF